jgi:hypothetical protein
VRCADKRVIAEAQLRTKRPIFYLLKGKIFYLLKGKVGIKYYQLIMFKFWNLFLMKPLASLLIAVDLTIIALFFLHLGLGGWPTLFDIDGELNVGAWWGGAKLIVAAAAIASVPLFASERRAANISLYWVVAIGLAYLSADEILSLHERITSLNKSHEIGLPMFRGTNGAWVGVYAVLFVVLLLAFLRPVVTAARADPKSTALVAGGFTVWVSGAVVVEVMGYYGLLGGMGAPPQVIIEESLELFGVSLLLIGSVYHSLLALKN